MANKLDLYDKIKLKEARNIICDIYDCNYKTQHDSLSRKLKTILKKIDSLIKEDDKR